MTTTPHAELPAHMVFIDQYDDSTFGSITDDAWGRDESSELKLGAPLYTAGQMHAYGEARERALLARLGEQPVGELAAGWIAGRAETYADVYPGATPAEAYQAGAEFALRSKLLQSAAHPPAAQPVAQGEREAFEAWFLDVEEPVPAALARDDFGPDQYADGTTQAMWEAWQAARSAAQGAAQVPQWLPISEAPKDGRKLVLSYLNRSGKRRTVFGRWLTDEQAAETDGDDVGLAAGWYECIDNWDDFTHVAIHEGEPDFFQPLPAAPHGEGER